jgi:hypothetical protein
MNVPLSFNTPRETLLYTKDRPPLLFVLLIYAPKLYRQNYIKKKPPKRLFCCNSVNIINIRPRSRGNLLR